MDSYNQFADIYDTLMGDVDYDAWFSYIRSLMGVRKSILECACGTGQMTLRLAKHYSDIVGCDISTKMLDVASRNLRNSGLRATLMNIDMRALDVFKERFDAVVAVCDAVNYLTCKNDVKRFFKAAYKALKSGGAIMFDVSSLYKLKEVIGNNTFAEDEGDCAYIWKNDWDDIKRLQTMDLTFFKRVGEQFECFRELHLQRGHSKTELIDWLTECGFCDISVYEAFSKETPNDCSERLQFVAYKV
ncbi:MAG: class I SAM-dependent methyltransferase [Clostridia bacterium]|nr:class I SAM-dependent methyltransferase [Clostridia bacterium]